MCVVMGRRHLVEVVGAKPKILGRAAEWIQNTKCLRNEMWSGGQVCYPGDPVHFLMTPLVLLVRQCPESNKFFSETFM